MASPFTRALLALVLAAITTACERPGHACTLVGGIDSITLDITPTIATRVDSVDVTLCQGDRCRSGAVRRSRGGPLDAPVFVDLDRSLGGGWKAGEATLEATARTAQGVVVAHREDNFRWTLDYPNGMECDRTPYLHHVMELGG